MKILVTGGAGYVGSVLVTQLIKNYHVKCLDRFFFGIDYLQGLNSDKLELIKDDIRWFEPKILEDVDCVLDLAALSNDPAGDLDPEKTFEINHKGRARVAKLSKEQGVKRYILASTASIYGFQNEIVDEKSEVNPLTTYAKANRQAEIDTLPLDDENFCVTALRFGTIFGLSPRMRFDLAVNIMTYHLFASKKITIDGDGKQSRPFLHVKDATKAYEHVISADRNKVAGEIFNVGSNKQNYSISDLATNVLNSIDTEGEIIHKGTNDHRSYKVAFDKIHDRLNFDTEFDVQYGVKEVYDALENKNLELTDKTITLKWYKHLIESKDSRTEIVMRDIIL